MGEVVPARISPTLHPPSPPTVHQLSRLALLRVNYPFLTCEIQNMFLVGTSVCVHMRMVLSWYMPSLSLLPSVIISWLQMG